MKKLYITLIASLLLTSCLNNSDKKTENNNNGLTVNNIQEQKRELTQLEKSKIFKEVKVEMKDDKLMIGDIEVSEGFPTTGVDKIKAPSGEKTYINSNVPAYYFFVTNKTKEDIFKYYRWIMKQNGYVEQVQDGSTNTDSLIFNLKTTGDIIIPQDTIYIRTSNSIPENLLSLKLKGLYVEISK